MALESMYTVFGWWKSAKKAARNYWLPGTWYSTCVCGREQYWFENCCNIASGLRKWKGMQGVLAINGSLGICFSMCSRKMKLWSRATVSCISVSLRLALEKTSAFVVFKHMSFAFFKKVFKKEAVWAKTNRSSCQGRLFTKSISLGGCCGTTMSCDDHWKPVSKERWHGPARWHPPCGSYHAIRHRHLKWT